MRSRRRGSYFYVIDAFIASLIIVGALLIVYGRHSAVPQSRQPFYTAEDFLSTAETTTAGSYDDQRLRDWINAGNITDPNRPLLEQLALFELTGNTTLANNLSVILTDNTPPGIGIALWVNGRKTAERNLTAFTVVSAQNADMLLTAKRIVLVRRTPTDLYEPAIVEVQTWQ